MSHFMYIFKKKSYLFIIFLQLLPSNSRKCTVMDNGNGVTVECSCHVTELKLSSSYEIGISNMYVRNIKP